VPPTKPPDLDRTDNCPLGVRCEVDGSERADLVVETFHTPLGVMCLTVCPDHAAPDTAPPIAKATAARLVNQHCQHLGINADRMAAFLESEE
jgi:hypothetical protein